MSRVVADRRRALGTVVGGIVSLLFTVSSSTGATQLSDWDFRDQRVPLWRAAGDVAKVSRTRQGMIITPSGQIPTVVAPDGPLWSQGSAYVRVRVNSPMVIEGARLGWDVLDRSGQQTFSSIEFTIPRGMTGGFSRTVWVRVADSPAWSGKIRHFGLAIPWDESMTERPATIESIGFFVPTWWTRVQVAWARLGLDEIAENMAVPFLSLNSIRSITLGSGTLHGYASWVGLVALLPIMASRWMPRIRAVRTLAAMGWGAILALLVLLAVIGSYLEMSAWRIHRAVFGKSTVAQVYTQLTGVNLVTIAGDLQRTFPSTTSVGICPFGDGPSQATLLKRARYQFYPLRVEARSDVLLVFARASDRCEESAGDLLLERSEYSLYRSK